MRLALMTNLPEHTCMCSLLAAAVVMLYEGCNTTEPYVRAPVGDFYSIGTLGIPNDALSSLYVPPGGLQA
jgi:hypothetical protein